MTSAKVGPSAARGFSETPLSRVAGPINFACRFLGFPLRTEEDGDRLVYDSWSAVKVAAVVFVMVGVHALDLAFYHADVSFELIEARSGMTGQDYILLIVHEVMTIAAMLLLLWQAARKAHQLDGVFEGLGPHCRDEKALGESSVRKLRRTVLVLLLLGIFYLAAYMANWYASKAMIREIAGPSKTRDMLTTATLFLKPFYVLVALSNPVVLGTALLSLYSVWVAAECYEALPDKVVLPAAATGSCAELDGEGVRSGLDLCRLTKALNRATSPFLGLSVAVYMCQGCILFYAVLGWLATNSNAEPAVITFSLSYLLRSTFDGYVLERAFTAGQRLQVVRAEVKTELEERLQRLLAAGRIEERDDDVNLARLGLLLKRLDGPAPVSPYSFFVLNYSGMLGAEAVIVTYLIVLLQFRLS